MARASRTRPSDPETPVVLSVTELSRDPAAALERARKTGQPLVITQRRRAAAVVLSVEAYERTERELHFLRLLARGGRDMAPRPEPERER